MEDTSHTRMQGEWREQSPHYAFTGGDSKTEDPRDWAGAEFACSGPDMIKPKDYCLNNWSKEPWQGCLDWSAKWKNSNPVKAEFERTKCKCQHGEGRKWTAKHGHDNLYANCEDW